VSKNFIFIYDYSSAKNYFKSKNKKQNDIIFSLCLTASNFLDTKKLKSKYILDQLSIEDQKKIYVKADNLMKNTLENLDSDYTNQISKKFNLNLENIFYSLYKLPFTDRLAALLKLEIILQREILKNSNYNFIFYLNKNQEDNQCLNIQDLIKFFFKKKKINYKIFLAKSDYLSIWDKLKRLKYLFVYTGELIKICISKVKKLIRLKNLNKEKKILFLDECEFFDTYFNRYKDQIIYFDEFKRIKKNYNLNLEKELKEEEQFTVDFFCQTNISKLIKKDFKKNFQKYYSILFLNKDILLKIKVACWNIPPVGFMEKKVIVNFLMSNKIKVIGRQHGDTYMQKVEVYDRHHDSDYNNCHYWLSYGMSEEDFKLTVGNKKKVSKIIPSYINKIDFNLPRRKIDILFIPRVHLDFYNYGFQPQKYENYKYNLLKKLDQKKNLNIAVKLVASNPLTTSNSTNTQLSNISKLKNLKIINDISFKTLLKYNHIDLAIFEELNTCLLEMLNEKTIIFTLSHPNSTFCNHVNEAIRKRVYFFENLKELEKGINNFLEGSGNYSHSDKSFSKIYTKEKFNLNLFELTNIREIELTR